MTGQYSEPAGPPQWSPGAGWERVRRELGDIVPDLTDEDMRRADELLAGTTAVSAVPRQDGPSRPERSRWSRRWTRRTA